MHSLLDRINDFSYQGHKVGEGGHREVYAHGDLALKITKPYAFRRYLIKLAVPTWLYSMYKLGYGDMNQADFTNFKKIEGILPKDMYDNFVPIYRIVTENGRSVLVSELVLNDDGSTAKALSTYDSIDDPSFWREMDRIKNFFINHDVPYFDLRGENIVVRERVDGHLVPVIIDYKKSSSRAYPFQLNLHLKSQRARKLNRRFSRLQIKYSPKTPSKTLPVHSPSQSP